MSFWRKVKGLFGSTGGPAAPSTQDLFADEVAAEMAKLPGFTSVSRGEGFTLNVAFGERTTTSFLDPIFAETRDMTAADRTARIKRFVGALTERSDDVSWQDARERLVPVLRAATFFHTDRPGADSNPIRRPFAPFLIAAVGLDSENSFGYVSRSQVAAWRVDVDTVFETARDNAREYFDGSDVAPYGAGGPYPLWHVARDDSYESSRLLVPGWLASFAGKVNGRPVAIVPSRSRLIVGGDGDPACLAQLAESARREFEASPRSISPALYGVDASGAVVPLVLPAEHPAASEVATGHAMLAASEYTTQKERLQAHLGDDVFVAGLLIFQRRDNTIHTVATWTKDVPTLLPRADDVALGLGVEGGEVFTVPWQALLNLAGDCLGVEPGCDPPRWRTEHWPDPVTFEKLRAAASS